MPQRTRRMRLPPNPAGLCASDAGNTTETYAAAHKQTFFCRSSHLSVNDWPQFASI
jgi:hypothetical protein